jgi:uncharacterized protein YhfF
MHPSVVKLWTSYRAIDPAAPVAVPASFHFCDNQEDADLCATLVVAGRKRATAASVAELKMGGDPIPSVGDYGIVTDWAGRARAVIRTTSVQIRRFGDVDEDFAGTEGEGDLTLDWWRAAHRECYGRVLAETSYLVDDDLEVVCEEFELVMTD